MIKSKNNLELPNCVPNHMLYFPEQYGGTQKGIPVTTDFLQEVSTHLGLIIDNGNAVYNFTNQEFLRNSEHFLPDPIQILSNEAIEAYLFLKYELRN